MFKKKRKVVKETSPLQSYEVGRIKENKYWYIKLLLFFGFFIAIIMYLPNITILYEKYFKGSTVPSGNVNPTNNNVTNNIVPDEGEPEEIEIKYLFSDDKNIEVNDLEFNTIKLNNNSISFNVKNLLSDSVDLEETNVYFEVYDQSDNLLKRIAISGELKDSESKKVSFSFEGEANYYMIKEILEDDYTYISLNYDNNTSTLTCTNGNSKIIYTFNDEKLTRINHTDTIKKTDNGYDTKYTLYNDLYVSNHTKTGITSNFNVKDDVLNYKIIIDYAKAAEKVNNKFYFDKDTSPRVVSFKVESWEYDCK